MREEYVTVEVEFKHATPAAVLVAKDDEDFWIPRSLVAWSTDKDLDSYKRGTIIDMKIVEFKASQLGWI